MAKRDQDVHFLDHNRDEPEGDHDDDGHGMDGNTPLFHKGQTGFQTVSQFSGSCGVGQQRCTGDHQCNPDSHANSQQDAFLGDLKDPEPHQHLALGQGHAEEEGKAKQNDNESIGSPH